MRRSDRTLFVPTPPPWRQGKPRAVCQLIEETARKHDLMPSQVVGDSQEPPFVAARRAVMHALRARGYSLTRIGKALGGMHHTTVLYHLQQYPLKPQPAKVKFNPDVPDESGIWAI